MLLKKCCQCIKHRKTISGLERDLRKKRRKTIFGLERDLRTKRRGERKREEVIGVGGGARGGGCDGMGVMSEVKVIWVGWLRIS